MYDDWHLRRWETPMSDAKHPFMDSLTDRDGLLQIEVGRLYEQQTHLTLQNHV
jgi:hypothetical protein